MTEGARVYPLHKPVEPRAVGPRAVEPLWREVLGRRLRALRTEQWQTLAETAARAGISPQYLSEVERGLKEPSSEMIAALAGALGTTLADLVTGVTEELRAFRGYLPGGRPPVPPDSYLPGGRPPVPPDSYLPGGQPPVPPEVGNRASLLNRATGPNQAIRSPSGPVALALVS